MINIRKTSNNITEVIVLSKKEKSKVEQVIESKELSDPKIISDVNGSYTGVPLNGTKPVQDADDL